MRVEAGPRATNSRNRSTLIVIRFAHSASLSYPQKADLPPPRH
jgi:hypothetical protein